MSERSKRLTDRDRRDILRLARQGLRPAEIARRLGLPGRSVAGVYSQQRAKGKIQGSSTAKPGSRPKSNPGHPGPGSPGSRKPGSASPVQQTINDINALQEHVNRAVNSTNTDDVLRAAGGIVELVHGLSRGKNTPNPTDSVKTVFSEIERLKQKDHWRKIEDEDRRRRQQRENEDRARRQKEKDEKKQREYEKQLSKEQQGREEAERQRKREEEKKAEKEAMIREEKAREQEREERREVERKRAVEAKQERFDDMMESTRASMEEDLSTTRRALGLPEEEESLCPRCIWFNEETGYCDANYCEEYDNPDDFDGLAVDEPGFIIGPTFPEEVLDCENCEHWSDILDRCRLTHCRFESKR